jgi:hypothetical protein
MDFAKSFSFVFDDPDWVKKLVIGGLVSLIPILGQLLVMGYMISVGRNVIRGNPQPLPEWDDFGQFLVDGLYAFVVSLVYMLPIFVVMCIFFFPALAVGGAFSDNGDAGAIGGLASCCFALFATIYGLAVGWFFLPAALARYADTGEVMPAFRFAEIWAISRENLVVYLMALLVTIVAGFIGGLGIIACGVGVLFTQFYAQIITGHAYGQAYLVATGRTTAPEVYP